MPRSIRDDGQSIDISSASATEVILLLERYASRAGNALGLLRDALKNCPRDENLHGTIRLFIFDFEKFQKELGHIGEQLPYCFHNPDALRRHADALRALSKDAESIQIRDKNMSDDYSNTRFWPKLVSDLHYEVSDMPDFYWSLERIASRLDVLYEPPAKEPRSLSHDVQHNYIFKDNFCVLYQSGKKTPLMKIARAAKKASVLRALFDAPKRRWLSWNTLKSEEGFSKDNPKEFFCDQRAFLPLLDIRPQPGNISDWNVRLKPGLVFSAE